MNFHKNQRPKDFFFILFFKRHEEQAVNIQESNFVLIYRISLRCHEEYIQGITTPLDRSH